MKSTKKLIECLTILGNIFPTDAITSVTLLSDTEVRYQLNGDKPRTIDLSVFIINNQ